MPVQLQVRTQLRASETKQNFEDQLRSNLSTGQINGKQKLDDLRTYLQGKGDNAQIRVVNTTRNADLAFQFKSFGYQPYRQERTAGALTQLLAHAGVNPHVASTVVNNVLKNGNNYQIATKAMVIEILEHPDVRQVIAAGAPPVRAQAAASPNAQAPAAQFSNSAANLSPKSAPKPTPHEVLTLIGGEFKNPQIFKRMMTGSASDLQFFTFKYKTGNDVAFHNLSNDPDAVISPRKGTVSMEDALFLHAAQKPEADDPPPFKYLLQARDGEQVVGEPMLVSRQELLANPDYANKVFQVLGAFTSKEPISDLPAEPVQPSDLSNLAPQSAPVVAAKNQTFSINSQASPFTLDQFLQAQGLHIGEALGKGGFGSVRSLGSVPDSSTQVVKYFEKNGRLRPETLSSTRGVRLTSEAYAAYLMTSRNADWVKPKITTPTHYLVGFPSLHQPGTSELKLVPIQELKKTIRENSAQGRPDLRCYGLIMDKAPGSEVEKQMSALAQNPNQRAMITQSGLETLKSLSSRGFVHRDIKPANLIFNGQELNFIDTGLLFKVRKTNADKLEGLANADPTSTDRDHIAQLPTATVGTTTYMHKDLMPGQNKGYIGTQADLHAFGLVTLQMEAPKVFDAVEFALMKISHKKEYNPMSADDFLKGLKLVTQATKPDNPLHLSSAALLRNMEDPNHLANLGYQCLRKADTSLQGNSAARWANRQFADQQYAELLKHPALNVLNGVRV